MIGGVRRKLLVMIALVSAPIVGNGVNVEHDPCIDEWRQMLKSPAGNGDARIRSWFALKGKCGTPGLFEFRLASLYTLSARYAEARKIAEQALATTSGYDKELNSILGSIDLGEAKLDEALARYQGLIKRYPEYFEGYSGAGTVMLLKHRLNEALAYLTEAKKRGNSIPIYRNLTITYTQLRRYEDAARTISEGYAADPAIAHDREGIHAGAIAYVHLGKLAVADGLLKMLFQADPDAAKDPDIAKTFNYVETHQQPN